MTGESEAVYRALESVAQWEPDDHWLLREMAGAVVASPELQLRIRTRDASRREYPEGVTTDAVDQGVAAVFAEFPGDTWRRGSLREVVGVVARSLRDRPGRAPESSGVSGDS